jgi:hypothetical protein
LQRTFAATSVNLKPTGLEGDRVTPSAKRACGDCTLCCKVMAIEALAKPAGSWCRHCKPGQGCAIYAERPAIMGQRMILVTPDREFDLGIVGPDERIVRELEGTKVVGATVVKEHQISHGWLVNVPSADAR